MCIAKIHIDMIMAKKAHLRVLRSARYHLYQVLFLLVGIDKVSA